MSCARQKLPKKLRHEPLLEVIWHLDFEATDFDADVLVGLLYGKLSEGENQCRVRRLPGAEIPLPLAQRDPNLGQVARYRLQCEGSPVVYQVGSCTVSVNCGRPYIGWTEFREYILELVTWLRETRLVAPQYHALRYIDLIPREQMPDPGGLQLKLALGTCEIRTQPFRFETELSYDEYNHKVCILWPAEVTREDRETLDGTLIDLEAVNVCKAGWDDIRSDVIDNLHDALNGFFFLNLLTKDTLDRLGPEYED